LSTPDSSYRQIVKSTGIFGGVQFFSIINGIIRHKLAAILLGPAGIGMIGMFQNIIDLVKSISGLGIETGAIKEIASNAKDKEEQARTISVFNWWVVLTACFGALICIVFCYPISIWAFEDPSYALPVALLSLCVFFTALSMGQSTVMQGTRMISGLAKSTLLGSFSGLVVSIIFYYVLGIKGIIPAFILGSILLLFFTNYYRRKLHIPQIKISNKEAFSKGINNLKLGLFVVSSGIINTASMFILRSYVNKELGMDMVGVFSAVWSITNVYLFMILKSMGTDYFPRLCGITSNNIYVRRLVNEQTYISLAVAIPCVVIMLLFSGQFLSLLYSSEFAIGSTLLRWQILGSFFKIIAWPVAFIMLAKGKGAYHLVSEIVFFAIYLVWSYLLFPDYGLNGIGIAYLVAYLVYLFVVFIFSRYLCKFRWSIRNVTIFIIGMAQIALALALVLFLEDHIIIIGIIMSIISLFISYLMLKKVLNIKELIKEIKNKRSR